MFIDITETINDSDIKFAIGKKDDLLKELEDIKYIIDDTTFNLLTKFLKLEESVCLHFELFDNSPKPDLFRKIYNYNLYYMSILFIKTYFEKTGLEFKCEYSDYYGIIDLTYKKASLLKITYANTLLTIVYHFSGDLNAFLDKSQKVLDDWTKYLKTLPENKETSFQKYHNYIFANFFYESFKNLNIEDINVINDFYNSYIKNLKIDLVSINKRLPIIAEVDSSYPHFWEQK